MLKLYSYPIFVLPTAHSSRHAGERNKKGTEGDKSLVTSNAVFHHHSHTDDKTFEVS